MKVNTTFVLDPNAPQYIPKAEMECTFKDRTKNNLENISKDILLKLIDENVFSSIKIFPTKKEV